MTKSFILAADVGGTNIRAAIVDQAGNIQQEQRIQAHLSGLNVSENDIILILSDFFGAFIKETPEIKAIGIGFPGFFIGNSGVLASSPNLPEIHNFYLAEKLSDTLEISVTVQNDALCAAIGEHRFGAGKGQRNLLHITLGTGIGGGLILSNSPYTGEGGMAMEFGHLRVAHDKHARTCGCGGLGCVEAYASATAVAARYFELTGIQTNALNISQRASNGEAEATNILESAGKHLGMAIAEAVKLLDIHTITISGGLTGAWDILHPSIIKSLNANLIPPLKGKVNILHSTLDDNAGILGARVLASSN